MRRLFHVKRGGRGGRSAFSRKQPHAQ